MQFHVQLNSVGSSIYGGSCSDSDRPSGLRQGTWLLWDICSDARLVGGRVVGESCQKGIPPRDRQIFSL